VTLVTRFARCNLYLCKFRKKGLGYLKRVPQKLQMLVANKQSNFVDINLGLNNITFNKDGTDTIWQPGK